MINIIGNHTSLTPLSSEIVKKISKIEGIKISPGLIVRKNIKVTKQKIILKTGNSGCHLTILMKGSKQFLRVYNCEAKILSKDLQNFCLEKAIIFQEKTDSMLK